MEKEGILLCFMGWETERWRPGTPAKVLKPKPKSFPVSPNRGMGITWALPPVPAKEIPTFSPGQREPGLLIFVPMGKKAVGGGCCVHVSLLLQDPSEEWGGKSPGLCQTCHELGLAKGNGLTLLPAGMNSASQTCFWASLQGDAANPAPLEA